MGGHSSSRCAGLLLSRPLPLWSTGSRRAGSVVVAHGLRCSAACGIFPDQGSNPCPLHWQADSQPLHHQGSFSFNDDIQVSTDSPGTSPGFRSQEPAGQGAPPRGHPPRPAMCSPPERSTAAHALSVGALLSLGCHTQSIILVLPLPPKHLE